MSGDVTSYASLFTTLAGAGATFVALTGGLAIQRLLTLQTEIGGKAADLTRANQYVLEAEQEVIQATIEGKNRYRRLVVTHEWFLDELYGNLIRHERSPSRHGDVSTLMRQERLESLLELPGDHAPRALEPRPITGLWDFAANSILLAKQYEEELASGMMTASQVVDVEPRPRVKEPWFDAGAVWEGMAERVAREHHADTRGGEPGDYVSSATSGFDPDELGRALSRLRDRFVRDFRDVALSRAKTAEDALETRKEERASISLPRFERSLFYELAVMVVLTVLMLAIPVLYLTPGGGDRPDDSSARAVTSWFLAGAAIYLGYFTARIINAWWRTRLAPKSETA